MTHRLYTVLIGPNTLFREGLKQVLQPTQYQARKVAETIDSAQFGEWDLIVMIAGSNDDILRGQVRWAKEQNPGAPVVVVSDMDGFDVVWPLLAAGADGYLLKTISIEALLASLDVVMLGGTVLPPLPRNALSVQSGPVARIDDAVAAEMPHSSAESERNKLSDRETDILLGLMKGDSNKMIGRRFNIAEATVKVHLKTILRKIHVNNRTQAAVWAHNNHLAGLRASLEVDGNGLPRG